MNPTPTTPILAIVVRSEHAGAIADCRLEAERLFEGAATVQPLHGPDGSGELRFSIEGAGPRFDVLAKELEVWARLAASRGEFLTVERLK